MQEIPGIIEDFKRGTANALAAGFDGVEIHGANGYLLDQFAKDGSNKRTDAYGGGIENRARLMLEVAKVVSAEAGAERTGIRISPVTPATWPASCAANLHQPNGSGHCAIGRNAQLFPFTLRSGKKP